MSERHHCPVHNLLCDGVDCPRCLSANAMREALKPFADLADFLDEHPDPRWRNPHDEFQCGDFPYSIGVGQLHAARDAYRALNQEETP